MQLPNGTSVATKYQVTADSLSEYDMLGPSIKLPTQFYADAVRVGKPIHPWVVDTPETLHKALEVRVDSAISNVPLQMQAVLEYWKGVCAKVHPELGL